MYCGLHFQFCWAHYRLWNTLYSANLRFPLLEILCKTNNCDWMIPLNEKQFLKNLAKCVKKMTMKTRIIWRILMTVSFGEEDKSTNWRTRYFRRSFRWRTCSDQNNAFRGEIEEKYTEKLEWNENNVFTREKKKKY
jgi:hypothetical protein